MKTKQDLYEKVMHYAHLLEDKLSYDEPEEGKRWGNLVNKLQEFEFDEVKEDKISVTYSFLRRKLNFHLIEDLVGINPIFEHIKDEHIFYITESQAKQFNLI